MVIVKGRILEEIDQVEEITSQSVAKQLTEGVYILFEQNNHCDCSIWFIKSDGQKLLKRSDAIYTRHARHVSEVVNSNIIREAIVEGLDKIAYLKRLAMLELGTLKIEMINTLAERIDSLKSEDSWLRRNIESIYQGFLIIEAELSVYKLQTLSEEGSHRF
mgnify:CR=1 FL=1|jgi:RNase adaptor protein for sRNA GlmZ degradation